MKETRFIANTFASECQMTYANKTISNHIDHLAGAYELRIRGYNVDVVVVEIFDKDKEGKRVRRQLEVDFVIRRVQTYSLFEL